MTPPAVVFGGPSPEHDISVLTGLQAARLLWDAGRNPTVVYWSKTGTWYQVDPASEAADFGAGPPPKSRELRFVAEPGAGWTAKRRSLGVETALLCCHGGPGEDGTLQAALDLAGIRYSGPGAAASALAMDKLAFGALIAAAGLPSLPRCAVAEDAPPPFPPPYIVKPRFGGSSIGIEVVEDHDTAVALAYSSPHMYRGALVEPYLPAGRDLNVAARTYPYLQLSAIEAPVSDAFYSYREKYLSGGGIEGSERQLPADIPEQLESRIRDMASRAARIAGVRSMARLDFLESGGALGQRDQHHTGEPFAVSVGRSARQPPAAGAGHGGGAGGIQCEGVLHGGRRREGPPERLLYRRQAGLTPGGGDPAAEGRL